MSANRRPLSVTIIACLYIAVGCIGLVFHLREILATHALHYDGLAIEVTELVALVSGVFLLKGQNWARWLALAWIAFHVAISAFDPFPKLAIHGVFCAGIAWALFHPAARQYFRARPIAPPPLEPESKAYCGCGKKDTIDGVELYSPRDAC